MRLVNVTNSHSHPVLNQLGSTDIHLVKVYTTGNTTIVYTEAPEHNEILLINDKRKTRPKEIKDAKSYFLNKIKDVAYHEDEIKVIELAGPIEISIPKRELGATLAM